jgi:hypothetical protein
MFTSDYADKPEIIRAAQVCGARLTKGLFPKWMTDQFDMDGKVTVEMLDNKRFRVTVSDGSHSEFVEGKVRYDG